MIEVEVKVDEPCGACPCAEEQQEVFHSGIWNKTLAYKGEEAAAKYLERRGMTVLERNWVCAAGEADIIAEDEDAIVFVEVKTRSNADYGFPEEAVTEQKRKRYERIAALYLKDCQRLDVSIRFDVIGILVLAPDRALIKHHINAFGAA